MLCGKTRFVRTYRKYVKNDMEIPGIFSGISFWIYGMKDIGKNECKVTIQEG